MTTPPPRKRAPGGGPKAVDGADKFQRVNVMLDPEGLAVFEKIGDGNISLGAREAARRLKESGQTRKFSAKAHRERAQEKPPSSSAS